MSVCTPRTSGESSPISRSAAACVTRRRPAFRTTATGRRASRLAWGLGHGQDAAENGVARRLRHLLRPLLLQLPAGSRALQRHHAAAVHRQPAGFLSADPNARRSWRKLATTSPTVYQVARNLQPSLHDGSGLQRGAAGDQERDAVGDLSEFARQCISSSCATPTRRCRAPTTLTIPTSGVRPFGGTTNIYQYNSEGVFDAEPDDRQLPRQRWDRGFRCLASIRSTSPTAILGLEAAVGGGGGFFGGGSRSAAVHHELLRSRWRTTVAPASMCATASSSAAPFRLPYALSAESVHHRATPARPLTSSSART